MNKKTIGLPYWVLIICMVFMTFSLLQGYVSFTARAWLWIPLACVMCALINLDVFKSRQFLWLTIYVMIVSLNLLSGKVYTSVTSLLIKVMTMLWAISFPFLLTAENKSFVRSFVRIELVVVLLTAMLSIIVDSITPGIIRQTAQYITFGQTDSALLYYRLGVCEYGLPHAIPIIIPAIIQYARNRNISIIKRIATIIIILLLSYFVFVSGVATAIILLVFAIAGTLLIDRESRKKTRIRLIILGLFALPLLNENNVITVLNGLADIVPEENSFHGKLVSIENSLLYDEVEGSVAARDAKYNISLESFVQNPIFGGSGEEVSGRHSVIMDNFGAYGLVGGIPFLLLVFFTLRFIYKVLPPDSRLTFIIGAICFVALLATKNMSNVYSWMFVTAFLPMLLIYEQNEHNNLYQR